MKLVGTLCDCSGYAIPTEDGELALRLRSPALSGGMATAHWIISDRYGAWYEAQPKDVEALEKAWAELCMQRAGIEAPMNTGYP